MLRSNTVPTMAPFRALSRARRCVGVPKMLRSVWHLAGQSYWPTTVPNSFIFAPAWSVMEHGLWIDLQPHMVFSSLSRPPKSVAERVIGCSRTTGQVPDIGLLLFICFLCLSKNTGSPHTLLWSFFSPFRRLLRVVRPGERELTLIRRLQSGSIWSLAPSRSNASGVDFSRTFGLQPYLRRSHEPTPVTYDWSPQVST